MRVPHPAWPSLHSFFQKSYLPGVIEVMLDHAVQQDVYRITRSRRDFFKPRVVDFPDAFAQAVMASFERSQRCLPGRLARIGHWREIDFVGNHAFLGAFQPPPRYLFPGNDVIYEFPDAVRVRDGSGGGLFGCYAVEQLAQGRAMPRLPFLSAFELAVDTMCFGHFVFVLRFMCSP